MPGVTQTLTLQDKMSPVLKNIMKTMQQTVNIMGQMNVASDRALSPALFQSLSSSINAANTELENMSSKEDTISSKAARVKTGFASWQTAVIAVNQALQLTQRLFNFVDKIGDITSEITNAQSRLELVNDGLQSQDELQQMIYESARRSNSSYTETIASVARIGTSLRAAGATTQGVVGFSELLNKSLVLSGTSGETLKAVLRQVSQAISSGVLRGDELTTVLEGAPDLVQRMADYLGGDVAKIRELASEGELTSDILVNSLVKAKDDIEADFATFPKTWKTIWMNLETYATKAFKPVLDAISRFLNSEAFNEFIKNVENGIDLLVIWIQEAITWMQEFWSASGMQDFVNRMEVIGAWIVALIRTIVSKIGEILKSQMFQDIANFIATALIIIYMALTEVYTIISKIVTWVVENWAIIKPILLGAVAIIGAIVAIVTVYNIVMGIYTAVTTAAATAQAAFNAVLMANPIGLIITGIILLIAAIVGIILYIKKLWDASEHFRLMWLRNWNLILLYVDQARIGFARVFAGIETLVDLWKTSFLLTIQAAVNGAVDLINGFIGLLNKLPGVAIETVQKVTFGTESALKTTASAEQRQSDLDAADVLAAARIEERESKAVDLSKQIKPDESNENAFTKMLDGFGDQLNKIIGGKTLEIGLEGEGGNGGETSLDTLLGGLDKMKANAAQKKTADNTSKMASSLDNMETDVKYLYEIAERQALLEVTTEAPVINFTNSAPIDSQVSVDSIIQKLETYVSDSLANGISGVSAYA
jgi:tape measure domain-containing protein